VHPLEVEVAELIAEVVPNAECVRCSKTGADAVSAAVRLARAFTGRNKVLCCGYHGWHDWYIGITSRAAGVPHVVQDLSFTFEYNDLESVERALDTDTACVVLEPMAFDLPRHGFLEGLQDLCRDRGALLVFDEMWTGFRLALGGAQERFKVRPDLACYSKAVANGMPLSVLTGRREVMRLLEDDVFFFTTFGGEALSLAAAKATIHELKQKDVPAQLARRGALLKDGYNAMAAALGMSYTSCAGAECRTLLSFSPRAGDPLVLKSFVQQELLRRGILWGGFHNMSFSHTDADVEYTLAAYRDILPVLRRAVDEGNVRELLRGQPVAPVFRKTGGFHIKPAPAPVARIAR